MENKEIFKYTYSAKEQEEIMAIREKYVVKKQSVDKMEQLRCLDKTVTKKATSISLVLGIVGALVLGIGMSFIMTDIGKMIGFSSNIAMLVGILIGIIGIVLVCVAYPIYNFIVKKEMEKIAPEIIRLADELLKFRL